jgi:hypothetical protein
MRVQDYRRPEIARFIRGANNALNFRIISDGSRGFRQLWIDISVVLGWRRRGFKESVGICAGW